MLAPTPDKFTLIACGNDDDGPLWSFSRGHHDHMKDMTEYAYADRDGVVRGWFGGEFIHQHGEDGVMDTLALSLDRTVTAMTVAPPRWRRVWSWLFPVVCAVGAFGVWMLASYFLWRW
jgi:hypothetical protein